MIEIKKIKKRFGSRILSASLWGIWESYNYPEILVKSSLGVNLLIGTESDLILLDRSGSGHIYHLISKRRFQQIEVLENLNLVITISGEIFICVFMIYINFVPGKKNKLRAYYLSWLKSKIFQDPEMRGNKPEFDPIADLDGCTCFKVVKFVFLSISKYFFLIG